MSDARQSPGGAPAAVSRTGAPASPGLDVPCSLLLGADGRLERDLKPRELSEALRAHRGPLWVDIDVTSRHQVAVLEKIFNFHPLAIEDALSPDSRVKVEEYPGYLFVIIRGLRFQEQTEDPYDLDTFNLCFFLGPDYLVTVHGEQSRSIGAVRQRVERTPDVLARGVARLMHDVMDQVVDHYFPIMDQIDEFIDGLEQRVFHQFDEAAMHDVFAVKRLVLSLRRFLAPQREVFNLLTNRPTPLLPPETQVYFRDVYDHVLRINDSLDTFRELLSSTMDSYLNQVSNRLAMVTKGLSIVATLSIPFVVVSGMWGMNFQHIPLSGWPYGFWFMLVVQLAIGAGLIALLRWRRWL